MAVGDTSAAVDLGENKKRKVTMKLIKTLSVAFFALALIAGPAALASEKTCCEKAKDAGKTCEHKCCVEATKAGKACEKCGGKKEEKK
jgi:hypothetical protein